MVIYRAENMIRRVATVWALLLTCWILGAGMAAAQAPSRIALVIGNAAYQGAPPLRTAVADAAIVAETMRAAGYEVIAERIIGMLATSAANLR